jgi:hypothetical protein
MSVYTVRIVKQSGFRLKTEVFFRFAQEKEPNMLMYVIRFLRAWRDTFNSARVLSGMNNRELRSLVDSPEWPWIVWRSEG